MKQIFIQKLKNKLGFGLMKLLRNGHGLNPHLKKDLITRHYEKNCVAFSAYQKRFSDEVYIENQHELEGVLYGRDIRGIFRKPIQKLLFDGEPVCAAHNSCEVIAVYNALLALHSGTSPVSFPALLRQFESEGITFCGNFGTHPGALFDYFDEQTETYETHVLSYATQKKTDFPAYIVTFWNHPKKITEGIHTVCITKDEASQFQIHNCYCEKKRFETLESALKHVGEPKQIIFLFGVKMRRDMS